MNGPVIFLAKGKKFHPRLRVNNLVTIYGLPEGSCVIPNKTIEEVLFVGNEYIDYLRACIYRRLLFLSVAVFARA